tara:strand:+ start:173 stop:1912 length:1740 start_codon:yes stop_codon:yes gene_type:complete
VNSRTKGILVFDDIIYMDFCLKNIMQSFKNNNTLKKFSFLKLDPKYFLLINIGIVILIFFERKFIYFRDYAIIWDGAYRLSQGLSPYTDFGMPVGPVSFYLPALFFYLFGASWLNLQLSQLVISIALIFTAWKLLNEIQVSKVISYLGLVFFTLNYVILLSHPWYNITGACLFLLTILLILNYRSHTNFLAGFICVACVFTKQDYGLMSLISSMVLVLFSNKDHLNNKIFSIPNNLKDLLKRLKAKRFFFLLFGLLLATSFFLFIFDNSQFSYWFNYGQFPHNIRRPSIIRTFLNTQFILSILCFWLAIRKKDVSLVVSFLVLLTSSLCSQTSGLSYTAGFFVFLAPLLLVKFFNSSKDNYKFIALLIISLLIINSTFSNLEKGVSIVKGIIKNKFEPYTMRYSDLKSDVIHLNKCARQFNNIYGPSSVCTQLNLIKDQLKERNKNQKIIFLNLSELTPFTAILNLSPPRNLPLWFHEEVTFFKREKAIIREGLINQDFDLIALQAAHESWSPFYDEILNNLILSSNYREIGREQYLSPRGSLYEPTAHKCESSLIKNYSFSEKCEMYLKPIRFFIKTN